jgi:DNA-binding response OmpR family regulator
MVAPKGGRQTRTGSPMKTSDVKDEPYSILVAHHEDQIRVALRRMLKEAGYHQIAFADSGRSTINRLLGDDYHLLIIPLEWPDLNCWQLLRMIETGAFCSPRLPVLIVCDVNQIPLAEPLAHEHQAHLLALDALKRLPNAVAACIDGPKKPTVLIIEDHLGTARLIELNLNAHFEVEIALTGEAGLTAWRTGQHDLVLLDLMLPDSSGLEVLQRIKAEKFSQTVAIITARSERETHQQLMLAGAAAFLSKPIDLRQLPAFCGQILPYGAYLSQRALQDRQQARDQTINQRVRAADFLLASGQAGMAAQHLKRALAVRPGGPIGGEEGAALLTEVE